MSLGDAMMLGQQWEEAALKRKLDEQRVEALNAKVGDVWWRYDDKSYATVDEWGEYAGSYTEVQVTRFKVVRVTPKGVQLAGAGYSAGRPRLQLHASHKRFACATQELALDSYVVRKRIQQHIYANKAKNAERNAFAARRGNVRMINDPDKINIDPDRIEIGIMRW